MHSQEEKEKFRQTIKLLQLVTACKLNLSRAQSSLSNARELYKSVQKTCPTVAAKIYLFLSMSVAAPSAAEPASETAVSKRASPPPRAVAETWAARKALMEITGRIKKN